MSRDATPTPKDLLARLPAIPDVVAKPRSEWTNEDAETARRASAEIEAVEKAMWDTYYDAGEKEFPPGFVDTLNEASRRRTVIREATDRPYAPEPKFRRLRAKDPVERKAIEQFGLTDNPFDAGFILPDGGLLDFSGKQDGYSAGVRGHDHRAIQAVYPDAVSYDSPTIGMYAFVARGSIRLHVSRDWVRVHCIQPPTADQVDAVVRLVRYLRTAPVVTIDVTDAEADFNYATELQGPQPEELREALREAVPAALAAEKQKKALAARKAARRRQP